MIHGIVIDVKGEELIGHINARVAHHEERAKACDAQLRKLRMPAPTLAKYLAKHQESAGPGAREPFTRESLERKTRQHRERAQALLFLGKHIVREETYHVTETDLRAADLLPDRSPLGDWLW